jgi:tight adherence protein B
MKPELFSLGVTFGLAGLGLAVVILMFGVPESRWDRRRLERSWAKFQDLKLRRLILATGAGLLVGVLWAGVTGWWSYVLLCPLMAGGLMIKLSDRGQKDQIERREAMAVWIRSLSGMIVSGTGLEHAIRTSYKTVTGSLEPFVKTLIRRINAGITTRDALMAFARELKDPVADVATCHLIVAAKERGPGLAKSLEAIAVSIDEQVKSMQDVDTQRVSARRDGLVILLITTGMLLAVPLMNQFASGYDTPMGQIIFIGFSLLIGLIIVRMQTLLKPAVHPRLLEKR